MKKVTSCILVVLFGLTLAAPAVAQTDQDAARRKAQKSSHKASKQYVKDQKKEQKKQQKRQTKAMKAFKKQHHVAS
jgi:Ni/Co efflux regulator RcnB